MLIPGRAEGVGRDPEMSLKLNLVEFQGGVKVEPELTSLL